MGGRVSKLGMTGKEQIVEGEGGEERSNGRTYTGEFVSLSKVFRH